MKHFIATSIFLAGAALGTTSSFEALGSYQVFEKIPAVPHPWVAKNKDQLDLDQTFRLRIHLKNQNVASFQQKVLDVATPGHALYGQHLSRSEVNDFLAPQSRSFDLLQEWLNAFDGGILASNYTVDNDWVIVETTIGTVEKLLQSDYQLYENTDNGKTTARTLAYSLPAELHPHVDIAAPTIKFSTPSKHRSTLVDWPAEAEPGVDFNTFSSAGASVDAACNTSITPACLEQLYGFGDFNATANGQFALAGFLEEYAQHDDLAKFSAKYLPEAVGSDFDTILINGGLNTQQNTTNASISMGEANLDIQYGLPIAYPVPTLYISTGGRPPETTPTEVDNEPYLEFLTYLLALDTIPQTISISYGDGE